MHNFKVKDRVITVQRDSAIEKGKIGTVVGIREGSISVEFDEKFDRGHTCDENAKRGHGRYMSPGMLQLIEEKEY